MSSRSTSNTSNANEDDPPTAAEHSAISSLDFECIVNEYSIQAIQERLFVPIPPTPKNNDSSPTTRRQTQYGTTTTTTINESPSFLEVNSSGFSVQSQSDASTLHTIDLQSVKQEPAKKRRTSKLRWMLPKRPKRYGNSSTADESSNILRSDEYEFHSSAFVDQSDTSPLFSGENVSPDLESTKHQQQQQQQHQQPTKKRRTKPIFGGYTGRTVTRWVLTCITGCATGMLANLILKGSQYIVYIRVDRLNEWQAQMNQIWNIHNKTFERPLLSVKLFLTWNYFTMFLRYTIWNLLLALCSAALCLWWATDAVGSGIPEMKAYLNGVRTKPFTTLKLFLVKIFGTIFSAASGLMIGPEGPLVHLGAIMGASLTKTRHLEESLYKCRRNYPMLSQWLGCGSLSLWRKQHRLLIGGANYFDNDYRRSSLQMDNESEKNNEGGEEQQLPEEDIRCAGCTNSIIYFIIDQLSHFRNDYERRDLVSIGVASGFAAAFGAPVGGVLFSLEECSTFFAHTMLWRTLTATAIATFCIAASNGDIAQYGVISLGNSVAEDVSTDPYFLRDHFVKTPLYAAVGIMGGLMGAIFNRSWKFLNDTRHTIYSYHSPLEDQNVRNRRWKMFEVAFVSILTSFLTFVLSLSFSFVCKKHSGHTNVFQFNCEEGEWNQLAAILFGPREEAIKSILSDPSSYDPNTLLVVGLIVYPLMVLTFGVALPSGIFMPTILTGASLGGYIGLMIKEHYNPYVSETTFALLGAAALLAGIQRSVVSLCVILMEGTGQTKILIPVIVTIVFARFVGDLFTEGLYEIGMELKEYPYLDHHVKTEYDIYSVSDIMSTPPITVHPIETAECIMKLLRSCPHHGFPVVSKDSTNKKFLGLVRRDQLVALLDCGYFIETSQTSPLQPDEQFSDDDHGAIHYQRQASSNGDILSTSNDGNNLQILEQRESWIVDNLVKVSNNSVVLDSDDTLPRGVIPMNRQTAINTDENGNLVVDVPSKDRHKHMNIAAVMNRGAKCVPETCPLSNAYRMFTTLGLRHLCVLGGETGGEVVGIITRYNMQPEFIKERTKWIFFE